MFVVKRLELETEERFETRDQLLAFLDAANAKVRQNQSKETFELEHLDQDDKLLEHAKLTLPLETDADTYLINFGKLKDKAGFPFPRRPSSHVSVNASEKSFEEIPLKKDKQDVRKAVSASPKQDTNLKTRKGSSKHQMLAILALFFVWAVGTAILSYGFYQEREEVQSLTHRISQLERLQEKTPAIDTFSRFFLPNYFTGNQDYFSDYFSANLQKASLDTKSGTLQSVILEEITKTKRGYRVTYILVVKAEDDSHETLRFTFTVKENAKATHGYDVVTAPKSSPYPQIK